MKVWTQRVLCVAGAASLLFAQACVDTSRADDSNRIKIGALLPFTGDRAAAGGTLERALFLAQEKINAAGGISGRRVRIVTLDTRSEPEIGILRLAELIRDEGVIAVIGPEDESLLRLMSSILEDQNILWVTRSTASDVVPTLQQDARWMRIAPSQQFLSLRLRVPHFSEGERTASIIHEGDDFGRTFANAFITEFLQVGGDVLNANPVSSDTNSFLDVIGNNLQDRPDAFVVETFPARGAEVVQAWDSFFGDQRLFLGPSLRSQDFVNNVPPEALENALGVSLSPDDPEGLFAQAFSERWLGEIPTAEAHYYYDAAILIALAVAATTPPGELPPVASDLGQAFAAAARAPGLPVRWDDVGSAIEAASAGVDIDYKGAFGDTELNDDFEVTLSRASIWRVENNQIVDD